jgi:hypothetical protein
MRRLAVPAKGARVTPCSHYNNAVNRQPTRLRLGSRIRTTCEHNWIHCSRASMFPSRSVRPHGANARQHLLCDKLAKRFQLLSLLSYTHDIMASSSAMGDARELGNDQFKKRLFHEGMCII